MTPEEREQLLRDVDIVSDTPTAWYCYDRTLIVNALSWESAQRLAAFAREQLAREPVGDDGDRCTETEIRAAAEWLSEASRRLNQDYENAFAVDQQGWHEAWQDACASNCAMRIVELYARNLGIPLTRAADEKQSSSKPYTRYPLDPFDDPV